MSDRVEVAIVGGGFMGGVHGSVLHAHPRATVRWVVDTDPAAAKRLAAELDAQPATDAADALADDAVGLVVVATPAATHAELTARALAAGRHVLVEKPPALGPGELDRLAATADAQGLVLAYGGNFAHAARFTRARDLAADTAAVGRPHLARVVMRNSGPDEDWFRTRSQGGGGALVDLGWHAVELCRWLLGKPDVTAVTAVSQHVTGQGEVEDQGVILLHFATGALGQCDVSWVCPGGEQLAVEVVGGRGLVTADLWRGMGVSAFTDHRFADVWEPNQGWVFPEWEWIRNSGYEQQDDRVLAAVLDGVPMPETSRDAVAVLQVLEAAYRSAESGQTVPVATDGGAP